MAEVRADWSTVYRRELRARPEALAAGPGICACGREVVADEPIVQVGAQVVAEADGTRRVDLSGTEWHPQECLTRGAA